MKHETKKRLLDALSACQAIDSFTEGMDFSGYGESLLIRSAVERQFEIVGEALNIAAKQDEALVKRMPELRRIVGLRNRIIHGYDSVDDELVWDIVRAKVPALEAELLALLAVDGETLDGSTGDSS